MINIIVDLKTENIEIESKTYNILSDRTQDIIKAILDKAYYSGETLCLETRDENGNYTELERWK